MSDKDLDRLEDEIGKDGIRRLMDVRRERAYKAEAQMVAAWYAATGELPPEGSEVDRLITSHVHREEREARRVERIIQDADRFERVTGVSVLTALRNKRKNQRNASKPRRKTWAVSLANELASKYSSFPQAWESISEDGLKIYRSEDSQGRETICYSSSTEGDDQLTREAFRTKYFSPAKRYQP